MLIPVIDLETTGFEEPIEAVEFAVVCVESTNRKTEYEHTALVRPGKSIEIGALATHHITDAMVKDELSLASVLIGTGLSVLRPEYVAAHNAAYDGPIVDRTYEQLTGFNLKWICTYRCAMHVWPDAPGHSNQVLRYFLGLPDPTSALPPHRALPDAQTTAQLLIRLLEQHTPEQLYEITNQPLLLRKLRFGKYRGELFSEAVPKDPGYFRWVLGQDFDEDIKYTIRFYFR